jgi:hypothetical protein
MTKQKWEKESVKEKKKEKRKKKKAVVLGYQSVKVTGPIVS